MTGQHLNNSELTVRSEESKAQCERPVVTGNDVKMAHRPQLDQMLMFTAELSPLETSGPRNKLKPALPDRGRTFLSGI